MRNCVDPRMLPKAELFSLKNESRILKLKMIFGFGDRERLNKIEKRINELKESLSRIDPTIMY